MVPDQDKAPDQDKTPSCLEAFGSRKSVQGHTEVWLTGANSGTHEDVQDVHFGDACVSLITPTCGMTIEAKRWEKKQEKTATTQIRGCFVLQWCRICSMVQDPSVSFSSQGHPSKRRLSSGVQNTHPTNGPPHQHHQSLNLGKTRVLPETLAKLLFSIHPSEETP